MADSKTIDTYDQSAKELAVFMQGIGSHNDDIQRALKLAGNPVRTRVIEIGCGDGRDAREITKRVDSYIGFDPSAGLLALAPQSLPNCRFVQSDALSFNYPDDIDVIFAFASLLHTSTEELQEILMKIHASLRDGGILYLTLKERDKYERAQQKDRFGERVFYYYNAPLIVEMARGSFTKVYEEHRTIGNTSWFTLALQKPYMGVDS